MLIYQQIYAEGKCEHDIRNHSDGVKCIVKELWNYANKPVLKLGQHLRNLCCSIII